MSTLREVLSRGRACLRKACVPDADSDAWELMEFVFDMEKSYYFLHENDRIDKERERCYEELIAMRQRRVPLQQITGRAWFMGYPFFVNSQVLIPRFDTEILVETVGKLLKPGMRILDLCTGSGCILLTLLVQHRALDLVGVGADLSAEALQAALENRRRLDVAAEFVESDLFSNISGTYDLIVSNPPYIASAQLEDLMPEVKAYEPRLALDGGEDGLDYYRRILRDARPFLKPGGWLCFEIGYDQGDALRELFSRQGYEEIQIGKDLAGLDRTAIGKLQDRKTSR